MYATNSPPSLTGRYRVRLSKWLRTPVLEIEVQQKCVASLRRAPAGDNIVMGYAWRKAKANDLIILRDMGVTVGG